MSKPGVIGSGAESLFSDSKIPQELEYILSPEPSHAGLLFLATSDPLGQIVALATGQEYSNIGFVSPTKNSSGKQRVYWLNPWGEQLDCLNETSIPQLLAHPLITKVGYRRLKDNLHSGKWGFCVATELSRYKEQHPKRELRSTIRQLLGFEKPEDTPLSVVTAIFENMGWDLEESTATTSTGSTGTTQIGSNPGSGGQSMEDSLSQILSQMFSPFVRPRSVLPTLLVDGYFTSLKPLQLQKPTESVRLLQQRDAINRSLPLLKQIITIIMEEATNNPEFLLHIMLKYHSLGKDNAARELLLSEYASISKSMLSELDRDGRKKFTPRLERLETERNKTVS